jgi:hypothetical protein
MNAHQQAFAQGFIKWATEQGLDPRELIAKAAAVPGLAKGTPNAPQRLPSTPPETIKPEIKQGPTPGGGAGGRRRSAGGAGGGGATFGSSGLAGPQSTNFGFVGFKPGGPTSMGHHAVGDPRSYFMSGSRLRRQPFGQRRLMQKWMDFQQMSQIPGMTTPTYLGQMAGMM